MANPYAKYAQQDGGIGPDPYKVNEEQRKQQAAQLAVHAPIKILKWLTLIRQQ
jgi:hypothetical protein